jgi:alpha-mannosidase
MTAWQLGTIVDVVEPLADSVLRVLHSGPHMATVELTSKHNDSEYRLTITLASGSPRIDFELDVNWLERGDPQTGVPALRASFPLAIEDGKANFEIPCGSIERPTDGAESPALNWVDLTGRALGGELPIGATLLNDCKYGHSVSDDTIRLTLLRSSYDPDPLPELGRHSIRYALVPHSGDIDLGDAIHAGHAFNHPLVPVGTTVHEGDLPVEGSALEILAPNVMLSGLKKAEDDDAIIIRLYEFEGRETTARVRLSRVLAEPDSAAVETDILEQPLDENTATMDGDVLSVTIPAFGVATVKVG